LTQLPASASRGVARTAVAVGLLFAVHGCDAPPLELGEAVDLSRAESLHALRERSPGDELVVVEGRVQEVCRSSGCWLVLSQMHQGKHAQLFVDLAPEASFTVRAEFVGRRAAIAGRLRERDGDLALHAVGLRLEEE